MALSKPQPERRRHALQERVREVILEGATRAFALSGGDASMADVATEAGVARATVYRHFPSREELMERLIARADLTAGERLDGEAIDAAPVRDAIVRSIRVLLELGDQMVVLAGAWPRMASKRSVLVDRLGVVMERGQAESVLRTDIPPTWLAEALVSTVLATMTSDVRYTREDSVEKLARLFLEGAENGEE